MIRTIDLFAGVGGIRLGAEAALKDTVLIPNVFCPAKSMRKPVRHISLTSANIPAVIFTKSLRLNRLTFCLVGFRVNRFRMRASEKDLVTLEVRCFLKLSVSFKSTSQKPFFSKM